MNNTEDMELIRLSSHVNSGKLVALEVGKDISLPIRRVFFVSGELGEHRGHHAHKVLTQILVCVNGLCTVICDDGANRKKFILDSSEKVLEIPPGIWAEQIYSRENTVLLVMCDYPFDEADYIRDYDEFIQYRKEQLT